MYDVRGGNPELPDADAARRSRGSLLPVIVVAGFCLTLVLGLVSVAGLAGLYIVAVLLALIGFVVGHYLLWGWWLTNKLREDERKGESGPDA